MNLDEDLSSDTSDEDYMPSGEEAVSSDEEIAEECDDDIVEHTAVDESSDLGKNASKKRNHKVKRKRKQPSGSELAFKSQAENVTASEDTQIIKETNPEESKQKADALWADFMKDVGRPTTKTTSTTNKTNSSNSVTNTEKPLAKATTTKEYDFAGETVRICTSNKTLEKQLTAPNDEKSQSEKPDSTPSSSTDLNTSGVKRPAVSCGGGLGSVLSMIGKKPKITTLEKSKLDWNDFKKNEGIEEDLAVFNRGKHGYLERQAFLQRSDERQFEQEREVRIRQMNLRK